jgi:hypothetical protein
MRRCCGVLLMLITMTLCVDAEEAQGPPVPDQKCFDAADGRWTDQELFVWRRLCSGEAADFNEGTAYGGDLDPKKTSLPDSRVLSSLFLKTILSDDKYRRALTGNVVRIIGARFVDEVRLKNAEIGVGLSLNKSLLEKGADFEGLRSKHQIAIEGSKVSRLLHMEGLSVDQSIVMDESEFDSVVLANANIGGQLSIRDSKVSGEVDLTRLRVNQSLFMVGAEFAEGLLFRGARIGGEFHLRNLKIGKRLDMNLLQVDHSLIMDGTDIELMMLSNAQIGGELELVQVRSREVVMIQLRVDRTLFIDDSKSRDMDLTGARIGGELYFRKSNVRDRLIMEGIQVNQTLYITDSTFGPLILSNARIGGLVLYKSELEGELDLAAVQVDRNFVLGRETRIRGPVNLSFSKIGTSIILDHTTFHKDVDLTGAQIAGELRLGLLDAGGGKLQWLDNSTLVLSNARVDAVRDRPDSWPSRIEVTGFTYRGLGSMVDRPLRWFQDWLDKQPRYTAAPYEQLATVLRSYGRSRDADEIMYTSKRRDHDQAPFPRSLWLTAVNWLIGYGHHIERALFWVAGFVIAGVAVLRLSGQGPKNGMPYGVAYSFDMLLPIIQLRKKHYEIDLEGWPRYYFYVHRIMGYVLAAFLGAGLAGLTK